jgi:hypothetical protein
MPTLQEDADNFLISQLEKAEELRDQLREDGINV